MKRPRSQSAIQRDAGFGQPPPKKQAVEATISQQQQLRTPVRRSQSAIDATKPAVPRRPSVRSTRPAIGAPPAFVDVVQQQQQQLLQQQARKTSAPSRAAAEVVEHQGNSDVRAWQKHYRKAFPGYVFFFENISADVLTKAQKQITSLGAVRAYPLVVLSPY